MELQYLAWKFNSHGGFATLESLQNVDDSYELSRGVSRSHDFPDDAFFQMDPSFPKEIKLADNILNLQKLIVASNRLKSFVEARSPDLTEYLSVSILNHKGRLASDEYFIINPLHVIDCINQDESNIRWNKIDSELISSCFGLVLDDSRVDNTLLLFRPKYMPSVVLVREDLVDDLEGADFTGLRFVELEEFEL